MIILAVLALCLSIACPSTLLTNTSLLSQKFQQKCVQILPRNSQEQQSLSSLLCGEKITDPELHANLQRTSLIHIFIISGSHLILFDELLSILRIPLFLRFLFLTLYSLAVGWQAPAVRALLGLLTRSFLKHRRLAFPADLSVLITGLLTLTLFPDWWSSLSLMMSWCAALALCWPSLLRVRNSVVRVFLAQISIFLFMCAPLWGLGSLHPLSLVYNLILAPVVSYLLLPLAFFTTLIPALAGLFDAIMSYFRVSLAALAEPIVLNKGTPPAIETLWLWILFWHVFMHFLRLRLWQGKDSP